MIRILLSLSLLVGCSTPIKHIEVVPVEKKINIDPKLLELCPLTQAPLPSTFQGTPEELLLNIATNSKIYNSCRNKQADSVTFIKSLINKE